MINSIYKKFKGGIEKTVIDILNKKKTGRTTRDIAVLFSSTRLASELERESDVKSELYLGIALGYMEMNGKIILVDNLWYAKGEYRG